MVSDARIDGLGFGSGRRPDIGLVEVVLNITGEDALSINRKNKSHWIGRLNTRIMIISNKVPTFHDPSGAIISRFLALSFDLSFEGKEDRMLTDKLILELPGIANWAIEGYRRLTRRGRFIQPDQGRHIIAKMQKATALVRDFVAERCKLETDVETDEDRLYADYRRWAEDTGHRPQAKGSMLDDLCDAFPDQVKRVRTGSGREGDPRRRMVRGIASAF